MLTLLRAYRSRGVARQGAERQRLLLAWADRMAKRFASQLSYDVGHLVVMQHLLPALWAGGHLGGRTYDVLMTGLPMRYVHAALDDAFARHPESPTLHDFRADPRLVDVEEHALAGARAVVTPHAASDACGLGEMANVTTVRAGDVTALRAAIAAVLLAARGHERRRRAACPGFS